tara:strand:- start:134 stop:418 length:285 start_codon:yes stop_codon:yes gene_type:complete
MNANKYDHSNDNRPQLIEAGDDKLIAEIMIRTNAFVSIEATEKITTLDKTTQYRERIKGRFPKPEPITRLGRRKGYRIQDLIKWIDDPTHYVTS